MNQLEDLLLTVIEGIRERPAVAAAILAGVAGAFVGVALAGGLPRRREPPPLRKASRTASAVVDLLPTLAELWMNPLVRSVARAAIASRIRRRLDR